VSPQRTQRPWQGAVEQVSAAKISQYDPHCYLCPGNSRAGGIRNPQYSGTFVFDNDFAALTFGTPDDRVDHGGKGLLVAEGEPGICRVLCFSPRHDLTLSTMTVADIEAVIDTWKLQFEELGEMPGMNHVQIFENRGAMMGASNPHPHCQIWATKSIPETPARELAFQRAYIQQHGACLLCEYLSLELDDKGRLVLQNDNFVLLVPFWATWPFEVLVLSRRHAATLPDLTTEERRDLADALKQLTSAYDRIFQVPFPYSMGFHQAPTDGKPHSEWHLHIHFYPPLLRSATVRKFMVGFEMLGTPQRDIAAETAAERLRWLVKEGSLPFNRG
jgi:UDPglucose--hexose-1-phosphate uridylyltransferase